MATVSYGPVAIVQSMVKKGIGDDGSRRGAAAASASSANSEQGDLLRGPAAHVSHGPVAIVQSKAKKEMALV